MNTSTKSRLENMIPIIVNHLKATKPKGGVADVVIIGSQTINYLVAIGDIATEEKNECQQYLCYLVNLTFPNGLPQAALAQLFSIIQNEHGYNETTVRKILVGL